MSLSMTLTRWALHLKRSDFLSPETVQAVIARRSGDAPIPARLQRITTIQENRVNGFRVITLTPKKHPSGIELIYNHGGAYISPLLAAHWWIIGALIRKTGCTVTVPLYGLAPEHTIDEALPFLDKVTETVRKRARNGRVFMAGDSAGGGLTLAHAIRSRDQGQPMPYALLLFSPWVDCTMTNPDIKKLERRDPMLSPAGLVWAAQQWAGGHPVTSSAVSPLEDSLEGLPSTYIYQGDHDIFLPDAKRFTVKAQTAHTPTELRIYAGGFHVFAAATYTPESRRALRHATQVLSA